MFSFHLNYLLFFTPLFTCFCRLCCFHSFLFFLLDSCCLSSVLSEVGSCSLSPYRKSHCMSVSFVASYLSESLYVELMLKLKVCSEKVFVFSRIKIPFPVKQICRKLWIAT